jgi:hypothetical protein
MVNNVHLFGGVSASTVDESLGQISALLQQSF